MERPQSRGLVDEGVIYSASQGRCSPRLLLRSWREEALEEGLERARRSTGPQFRPRKPPVPRPNTSEAGTSEWGTFEAGTPRARAGSLPATSPASMLRRPREPDFEVTKRVALLQTQLQAAALQIEALRGAHESLGIRCAELEQARRKGEERLARQGKSLARNLARAAELEAGKLELAGAVEAADERNLELQLGLHLRDRKVLDAAEREAALTERIEASEAAVATLSVEAHTGREAAARLAGESVSLAEGLAALRQTHEVTRVELLHEAEAKRAAQAQALQLEVRNEPHLWTPYIYIALQLEVRNEPYL